MSDAPILLANARLIDPDSGCESHGGLWIEKGSIRDLGPGVTADGVSPDVTVIDCQGHIVCPGLVDMAAFLPDCCPQTLRETGASAARGGITTVACMVDTAPFLEGSDLVGLFSEAASALSCVHLYPYASLTKELAGHEMAEIGLSTRAGAIAVSDGLRSVQSALMMRRLLATAHGYDALVVHHVEDATLSGGLMHEGELSSRLGLPGIPYEAETVLLDRDLRLLKATPARYHAAFLSCADSVDRVDRAKQDGLPVTCGVSINALCFNENDIGVYNTAFKLRPPLRTEQDRMALVSALGRGVIDVVASCHRPRSVEAKRLPFAQAAEGAVGLETLLSAGLRLVRSGDIPLVGLLRALSTRPAEVLRLPCGRLKAGAPADLIVLDADAPYVLDGNRLQSQAKNTPFDRARLEGQVLKTFVSGKLVYESG